jgi:hypothetical protein
VSDWTPVTDAAQPAWKLTPRWLELEQDGFLRLDDGGQLALEEDQ